jgi:methionyl-tRNA formyltransferase
MKKRFKTVFMGTPEFAVPSLEFLHDSGREISCVVTQPDRPKGRGRKPTPAPIKSAAIGMNLTVLEVESIRDPYIIDTFSKIKPDLFVVVAFGQILPKTILDIPGFGSVNIHASLLPRYRGPAPIQWAIINREKETGVTAMLMDEGMDTGKILLKAGTLIHPDETSISLHDRLAVLGAHLLMETVHGLETGEIIPLPQDHADASYAPILKKEDGRIDWKLPAERIEAFIRGMTPWPGAFTFIETARIKIFKATAVPTAAEKRPGRVICADSRTLLVSTGSGAISILEVQPASGKRQSIHDFMRGRDIREGILLE